jgi:hypothetical protein
MSEGVSQRKLKLSAGVKTLQGANGVGGLTKLRKIVEGGVRVGELLVVGDVKGFCAENDLLFFEYLERLEQGHVEINRIRAIQDVVALCAEVSGGRGGGSEVEVGWPHGHTQNKICPGGRPANVHRVAAAGYIVGKSAAQRRNCVVLPSRADELWDR